LKKINKTALVAIPVVLIALGVGASLVIKTASHARSQIPVIQPVPDFTLSDQNGRPFGLQDLKGQANVVAFIFTSCQGPCPIMTDYMSQLYQQFGPSKKVRFVSISVDPERDTEEALQAYAQRFQIPTNANWYFLRGPIDSIVTLSEKGFLLPAEQLPMGHSTRLVLVDENGNIRGYYNGTEETSVAALKTDLKELVKQSEASS
jgi:protein SCO1/2